VKVVEVAFQRFLHQLLFSADSAPNLPASFLW
jgi:hypothetical protein